MKNGVLSITGVEGPMSNGNCKGACGQIEMFFKTSDVTSCGEGWTIGKISGFLNIWRRWHLNDLKAGCEHQRNLCWNNKNINESCPVCGYKYGTKWLKEELPQPVINYLESLPESKLKPAWI